MTPYGVVNVGAHDKPDIAINAWAGGGIIFESGGALPDRRTGGENRLGRATQNVFPTIHNGLPHLFR